MTSVGQKVRDRSAHIVVVGIGYVGLPLAVAFARAGFRVTGYDRDEEKVRRLARGESYIPDVPSADLAACVASGKLEASTAPAVLAGADGVIICVPTPLSKTRDPDVRYIVAAAEDVARHQHPDMLIVLESTTYPGTTTEVLVPMLTRRGFTLGRDVYVAFSPERVDPGNQAYGTKNTPKVMGGATAACLACAVELYSSIVDTIVPVSSTETAEMVKLLENTFRAVNIGLVNEIAIMSRKLGIDPFEVVRAASTKPFGFMPFYPGPGLGGHCIPIDPLYLSWKLRALQYHARFIELADSVNRAMPEYVVSRTTDALNDHFKPMKGATVLVYGVAYKRDVSDIRESPALNVIQGLMAHGAVVSYMDPFVDAIDEEELKMTGVSPASSFAVYDAVVIVTDHAQLDRARLLAEARVIVDTRDTLQGLRGDHPGVYGL